MSRALRILHLEDDPADRELIPALLSAGGHAVEARAVSTRADFLAALAEGAFDLILADCRLPAFDGMEALALARERRPDIPFLFVSGFIGEEAALESLKHGATDYVFKHNLARLAPAVDRALRESASQRRRQEVEAALQERQATLDSFFNTAPFLMGVVEVRPEGLWMVSANAAAAAFAGVAVEALQGSPLDPGDRRWDWLMALAGRLASAPGSLPREAEFRREEGGRVSWLTLTASPLPEVPGRGPRFCFVASDVTDRKQLEEQFLRAQRLESIGRLASGIAHDLNNVLAPMLMSLRVFRPKLVDPEDAALLATLEASGRRGRDIIRQLLTFARGTPGAREPVDLAAVCGEIERVVRETFPRTIGLELRLAGQGGMVIGDATQLYQVVMNLCLNARDAMPEGGLLRLSLEAVVLPSAAVTAPEGLAAGDHWVLTVADSGPGIPAADLERVFEPFFTTKPSGTGLGLPTAAALVKSHGGRLTAANAAGQGAVFRVWLPRAAGPAGLAATATPVAAAAGWPGDGHGVLVVDDEVAVRQAAAEILRREGYRVWLAAEGGEALRLLEETGSAGITLVLTDLMMPGLAGEAFLGALRERHPGLVVIAMSGLPQEPQAPGEPGPAGVRTPFLAKPFEAEALLRAVGEALPPRDPPGQPPGTHPRPD
ncbi:MAG: hypothetical protein RJA22_1898 [Verrucomicrobiota bacterium]